MGQTGSWRIRSLCYSTALWALVALVPGQVANAQDAAGAWVTDEFEVTMRTGQDTSKSIVSMLKSGTRVERLERPPGSDYSRVRTGSGAEGWVLNRYLLSRPPARVTLPDVERRLQQAQERRKQLESQVRTLTEERNQLQGQLNQQQNSSEDMRKQLDDVRNLSSNVIQIDDQNKQLRQRLIDNERALDELKAENSRLASRSNREWFVIGAMVIMFGILVGLILPRIRWRKKSSWGDL
jgi:SH3 domain protein